MSFMGKTLVLFTKGFPYNISEPFLENEYPLYKEYFDRVLIVTGCKKGEKPTRDIQDPVIHILDDYTLAKDKKAILEALPYVITDKMFYRELWRLIKEKKFSTKRLYRLLVMSVCGNHRALLAKRWIDYNGDWDDVGVVYSYWLDIPAYAAVRLVSMRKNHSIKAVSRCHGFDVYAERRAENYLPFQRELLDCLDIVASVSKAGAKYLLEKYQNVDMICTRYLGCKDKGAVNPFAERDTLRIVSCARVVPLKRLERIVDGLRLITGKKIIWTHIGGGDGLSDLVAYAEERLPPNIVVNWAGTIQNEEVYDMYKTIPFHAFVSVSSTEGLPVSMCEAFSFHIPIIATDVGGVSEVVDDYVNGLLLSADFTDDEFAQAVTHIASMNETDYQSMRKAARSKFEGSFDAITNNHKFIEDFLIN